ncbi:MAG: hypothetical protein SOZ00_04630 [Tidjanibacter sp.]|nr:hypothetical protein [Tidjanibacter sp.]
MKNRRERCLLALCIALWPALGVSAQSSSLNTYSPYTCYGIGDIRVQGPAILRAMGGTGIGYRNAIQINSLNPASYSSVRSNSFLLNFDMEGQNFYERSSQAKTSFNTFNIRDISMAFPLSKRVGMSAGMTPYSSVGYRIQSYDQSPDVLANIGQVSNTYMGSGGVTQFKLGIGWEIFDGFSLGGEAIYYHGSIARSFSSVPTAITGSGSYQALAGQQTDDVNAFYGNFGLQWNVIANSKTLMTVGATYQMGGNMHNDVTTLVPVNSTLASGSYVVNSTSKSGFSMPNRYGVGLFVHRIKYAFGADYEFADWGTRNNADRTSTLGFRNTNTVRLGGQYTPSPGDVRSVLRRWTYRAGLRFEQYYMVLNQTQIDDMAFTCGLSIPLRMTGLSNVNLGAEIGQRGTTRNNLVKETYFKFTVGFSLFGEDYWFVKYKFD